MKYILMSVLLVWGCLNNTVLSQQQINCSGVFPHLAMVADQTPRTEAGTGALFPWANRLWVVTYVAHFSATGFGTGLLKSMIRWKYINARKAWWEHMRIDYSTVLRIS